MCGIVGFISASSSFLTTDITGNWNGYYKSSKREDLLKNLLVVSALRGIDSTGVAQILPKQDYINVSKLPINSIQFIKSADFDSCLDGINYANAGYIGHTRHGTVGQVSLRTSHPFDMQTVVGVHNGTLSAYKYLWDKAASDSEALYHALDQTNDYVSTLENVSGAFALVWYDKLEKKYFFTRNNERPLVYVKHPTGIIFASELEMIKFGLSRVLGDKFDEFAKDCEVAEFETYKLYCMDPDDLSFEVEGYKKFTSKAIPYTTSAGNTNITPYHTAAEKASPVKPGYEVELHPTGYKEYDKSDSGMGTLWGYFMVKDKCFFWNSYGVTQVKKLFEDYCNWDTRGYPEMSGSISSIHLVENEPNAREMDCPLYGLRIHPEMTEDFKYISHSIKPASIKLAFSQEVFNA